MNIQVFRKKMSRLFAETDIDGNEILGGFTIIFHGGGVKSLACSKGHISGEVFKAMCNIMADQIAVQADALQQLTELGLKIDAHTIPVPVGEATIQRIVSEMRAWSEGKEEQKH